MLWSLVVIFTSPLVATMVPKAKKKEKKRSEKQRKEKKRKERKGKEKEAKYQNKGS